MVWFKNLRELLSLPKDEMSLCMVVSEQEGAEIWIDGKKTQYLTPKLVAIPKNTDVQVTVHLFAHDPHTSVVRTAHDLCYFYCDLKRTPFRILSNDQYQTATH